MPRALASIASQSRPPDEVIVVDDGSTDETAAWVEQAHPEVQLIVQENRGVSAARNTGIRRSRGSHLAFLDSDDAWLPEKLELQLAAMDQTPGVPLCHTDEIWIRNGRRVNPMRKHQKHGGQIFEQCLPLCAISPSSVLLERRLLDELGAFDEELPACEDYDLWLRITARYPVLFVDERLLIKHGGHPDQLSRRHWGMDRFRIRALEKLLAASDLDPVKRSAASETLREKIAIYAAGARKRGRSEEAEDYEKRLPR